MSSDSPSMTQRHRSSGNSKQFVCRSIIAQLHTSCAFGHARHRLVEVAGVVDVVVRQEDPPHVLGLDEREHVLQPLLAVGEGAGVDDHRLRAEDHHRVQVDEQRLAERGLHLSGSPRCRRRPASAGRTSSARAVRRSCRVSSSSGTRIISHWTRDTQPAQDRHEPDRAPPPVPPGVAEGASWAVPDIHLFELADGRELAWIELGAADGFPSWYPCTCGTATSIATS